MRFPHPLFLGALLALFSAPAVAQPVLFVDADAGGAADGSSWADAFPDLQQALAVAEAGDEVWVAEGTYRPGSGTDRDAAFVLVSGTGLYGGFDGTEDARDERDPEANATVLSGDLGVEGEIGDNAYHVVVASGVDESTVLDGFTVTGGNGDGASPRNRGGGIYAENSSLVVRNCRIVENRVVQTDGFGGGGGAFFGTSGTPRFERVAFERNEGVSSIGGGIWLFGGDIADMTIGAGGGGLSAVLREVAFVENVGKFGGGARIDSAPVAMIHTAFIKNTARDSAGGALITGTEGRLINVSFFGNTVNPDGTSSSNGGMNAFAATLTLTNVAFVGNTARRAGAYGQGGGTSILTNVTFTANEAEDFGGIRLTNGADMLLHNGVVWNNEGGEVDEASGTSTLSHILISGGCPLESTCEVLLDDAPLFVRDPSPGPDETWGTPDDDYGDLRLQESSPALDFGLAGFLPPDTFDLDSDGDTTEPLPLDLAGEARVVGASVDLGAYEWQLPVASEPEPARRSLTLDVYPNPARGPVAVSLRLDRAERTEVTLFDVRGRRVAMLHDGPLAAGRHTLRLETVSLPSGVYLVRIEGGAASLTRRLIVLR